MTLPAELAGCLERHPETRFVDAVLHDLCGSTIGGHQRGGGTGLWTRLVSAGGASRPEGPGEKELAGFAADQVPSGTF